MARGQELFSGQLIPQVSKQPNPVVRARVPDPASRVSLMIAHWETFANRSLRKFTRKYMSKMWRIEKRRRVIVMRQNGFCSTWQESLQVLRM